MRGDKDILESVDSQCPVGKVVGRWPTEMLGAEGTHNQASRERIGRGRWPSLNCKWEWRWRIRGRRADWMFVAEAMGGAGKEV